MNQQSTPINQKQLDYSVLGRSGGKYAMDDLLKRISAPASQYGRAPKAYTPLPYERGLFGPGIGAGLGKPTRIPAGYQHCATCTCTDRPNVDKHHGTYVGPSFIGTETSTKKSYSKSNSK